MVDMNIVRERRQGLPHNFDWERDIHSQTGRHAIREVAEHVVEIAKEIKQDVDAGLNVHLLLVWRGAVLPVTGILHALKRMGIEKPEEKINLCHMLFTPEESTVAQTRKYIKENFDFPKGSVVYYPDEVLVGNSSGELATAMQREATAREVKLKTRLWVSHQAEYLNKYNRADLESLQDCKLLPV